MDKIHIIFMVLFKADKSLNQPNRRGAIQLGLETIVIIIIAIIVIIVLFYLIQSGLINQLLGLKSITNTSKGNVSGSIP